MKKFILASLAAAAVIAPMAVATSAHAVTTTSAAPDCVPVTEVAAVAEVNHIEYKYKPVVNGTGPTHWALSEQGTSIFVNGVAYVRDGVKTQTVIDSPAVAAVDGVTCEIPFPANPLLGLKGISPIAVIPTPAGTEQYTFGPVTNNIRIGGRIATTVTAKPGYVFTGGVTTKSYYATVDNTGYVFYSQTVGHHINLPDVFDIEHAGEFAEGTYWATKVSLTIVNDTNTDQEFRIRYADVQDGDRVWVQGTRFTDGLPNNVVPANSSRPFEIEVWHNVVSGADVPNDLTLDFGFELA